MLFETHGRRPASNAGRKPPQRPPATRSAPRAGWATGSRSLKPAAANATKSWPSRPRLATSSPNRSGSLSTHSGRRVGVNAPTRSKIKNPSVFNNFGQSKLAYKGIAPVAKRSFPRTNAPLYSPKIGTTRQPRSGYGSVSSIDPRIFPGKIPQTGGPGIDNPGRMPGTDWGNQPTCSCGGNRGCTTLSHFALGSSELTPQHKVEIAELARSIIAKNINVITLTGHTDVTGTDENNMYLGHNRAKAVRKELINTLHGQKPWSPNAIYFRTTTKGESEPVSETDNGQNRRVEVCIQEKPMS